MGKIIKISIALTMFAVLLSSCESSKTVIKSVEANKIAKTFKLKKGEELKIELTTNPSTGHSWILASKIKPKIISFEKKEYKNDDRSMGMIGAGGIETWTFKTIKKGKLYLHMKYQRSKNTKAKAANEKYFEIIVE